LLTIQNAHFSALQIVVFAKVGRLASEEVILELLIRKYLPVLLYGLEVHVLIKRALRSLDFSFNRFYVIVLKLLMRKLFSNARKCFTVNHQAFSSSASECTQQKTVSSNFIYLDEDAFVMLYKSLVRSHLEYANSVWNPHRLGLIKDLEKVQMHAIKLVISIKNFTYKDMSQKVKIANS